MSECCHKNKHREPEELYKLNNRLKRIEGQVRGVQKMLENDAYCTDILTQVSAIQSALNAFNQELLISHINTCVIDDIKNGNDEVVTDLVKTIKKLMK
ncbi:MAG: metal-sensing transcriptional repressor [Eubacteriales bacterium]